jgi:hypothetical protein
MTENVNLCGQSQAFGGIAAFITECAARVDTYLGLCYGRHRLW